MYEITEDKEIKVGTLVQTIFGERWGRVVEIDEVEVLDKVKHMEPRYHVEVGQKDTDLINNFKPYLTGDGPAIIRVVRREIAKAF